MNQEQNEYNQYGNNEMLNNQNNQILNNSAKQFQNNYNVQSNNETINNVQFQNNVNLVNNNYQNQGMMQTANSNEQILNNNITVSNNEFNPINIQEQPIDMPVSSSYNSNFNEQQTVQSLNDNNNSTKSTNNKNLKKILLIIIIICVVSIIIFICCTSFLGDKTNNKNNDIDSVDAFFLQDSNNKYGLFNDNGEQLTDFIYTSVGKFINGTAPVEEDGKEGIINSKGKLTLPLGKYKDIHSYSGLYRVEENKDKSYERYLINSKGKILYDLADINVKEYNKFLILEFEEKNKYSVINYEGKKMFDFKKSDDREIDEPTANELEEYVSIYYNNKNWIINADNGKKLATFDSKVHYCINDVSEDGKIVILSSCTDSFWNDEETYFKFIKDGKMYDKINECESIWQDEGNIYCSKESEEYLLDENLNVGIEISGKAYSDYGNSYVMDSSTSNYTTDFYDKTKKIKSVSCRDLKEQGYMSSGIYLLKTRNSSSCGTEYGQYEYYNSKGERLFNKYFKKATLFDSNDLAVVSDDKEIYYLIDKNGKQVGNTYSSINFSNNFYIMTKNDLYGIMDKEGKEIISPSYFKVVEISTYKDFIVASLQTSDGKYVVYDLKHGKKLFLTSEYVDLEYDHYITTSLNNKTQYYSYNGKMFYEK